MREQPLRVFLVDDEVSLRAPLVRHLNREYGYHVVEAATFAQAVQILDTTETPFDVALIDDMLMPMGESNPEPLGIDLMAAIHEYMPDTESILFTGWGEESKRKALQAGAFRYIQKPFDTEELALLIRTAATASTNAPDKPYSPFGTRNEYGFRGDHCRGDLVDACG